MIPKEVRRVHFIGIGGYGMSALAQVLLQMGYLVSGSDLKETDITRYLEKQGALVSYCHHPGNVASRDLAVYSTAIPPDNPEILEAARLGLSLWHRSELLAALLNDHYGIAVAGTHGKTTTTAMLSLLLERGGLDPTAVVGGLISTFSGNARLGSGPYLVAEACESDHSFLRYRPRLALVTNIEADHLEHYEGDFGKLKDAYRTFLENIVPGGCAVLCLDDLHLRELVPSLGRKVVTYSLDCDEADFRAGPVTPRGFGTAFTVFQAGRPVAEVTLSIPGRHNALNAVGALAAARELGLEPGGCAAALAGFRGAGRRFEILAAVDGITVIDDYAHHPTEVRVTIQAARAAGGRVLCAFQPHRYSRTAFFMDEFAHAFQEADLVLLHRIYAAGEKPVEGVSSAELARRMQQVHTGPVYTSESLEDLADRLLEEAGPGDNILIMGAGDINKLAYQVRDRLVKRAACSS